MTTTCKGSGEGKARLEVVRDRVMPWVKEYLAAFLGMENMAQQRIMAARLGILEGAKVELPPEGNLQWYLLPSGAQSADVGQVVRKWIEELKPKRGRGDGGDGGDGGKD